MQPSWQRRSAHPVSPLCDVLSDPFCHPGCCSSKVIGSGPLWACESCCREWHDAVIAWFPANLGSKIAPASRRLYRKYPSKAFEGRSIRGLEGLARARRGRHRRSLLFFFRRAADIAQRLGPESWINAKRRQKMDVNSSPSCTSQSLQWQTQHQHRQQVRRSANPPARFAYYRLPKTRKQQQHGARAQDRNTNFATKSLKGNSTPQCQNQKHAIETN